MITIGLCGSTGAGKGYVCERFRIFGVEYIDTDRVYSERVVTAGTECMAELRSFFGDGIIHPDGTLDRAALSKKVFEGENAQKNRATLNKITHKYIKAEVLKLLAANAENGIKATVIDAPVLFESGFDSMCDITVCVTAPQEMKLERVVQRDGISCDRALARLQGQLPDSRLRELCDYEIVNDGVSNIDAQITEILRKINL